MESIEYTNAFAYLNDQIDQITAKQDEYHKVTQEKLDQWSKTNSELAVALKVQAKQNLESTSTYQLLAQHLLSFGHVIKKLGLTTVELEESSEKLVHYLIEEQVPQLKSLESNSQRLQLSSNHLEIYLKEEQSQRLKLLEASVRRLLEILEEQSQKTLSSPTVTSSETRMTKVDSLPSVPRPQSNPSTVASSPNSQKKQSYSLSPMQLFIGMSVAMSVAMMMLSLQVADLKQLVDGTVTTPEQIDSSKGIVEE